MTARGETPLPPGKSPFLVRTAQRDQAGIGPYVVFEKSADSVRRKFWRRYKVRPVSIIPAVFKDGRYIPDLSEAAK